MLNFNKCYGTCEFCYIYATDLIALSHQNRNKYKISIMAQTVITVRLDSKMKAQFDALCEQFGMSANTAFNVFVKAVVRSRSIPFAIKGSPSALELFNQQRKLSEATEGQELSLDEINEEIRAARKERRKLKPQHDICRY